MVDIPVYYLCAVVCQYMTIMAVGTVLRNQRVLYSILDIEGETFCFQENIRILLPSRWRSSNFAFVLWFITCRWSVVKLSKQVAHWSLILGVTVWRLCELRVCVCACLCVTFWCLELIFCLSTSVRSVAGSKRNCWLAAERADDPLPQALQKDFPLTQLCIFLPEARVVRRTCLL